ncbi:unnamed protein product [Ilex paraguariensis]|uniref:Protein kinase domain-containing protein n=1 Tax=Ilex paraguariensis TaxID=185542 RepID=A0ABC8SPE8_9AQUA
MPQLRSGVRRGRRPTIKPDLDEPDIKKPRTVRATRQRRPGGRRAVQNNNRGNNQKEVADVKGIVQPVVVVDDDDDENENAVKKTTSLSGQGQGEEQKEEEIRVLKEEVGEKEMDEYDSGGRSGDKGVGAEDEGSTAPLPEKVQVGGSPMYRIERKLGKGGFGQVYVGRRTNPSNPHERTGPGAVEVALKFEHRSSKGCNYGPPYEWQVYK